MTAEGGASRESGENEAPLPDTGSEARLDTLLSRAVALRASDLLLVAGFPPAFRVHGRLVYEDLHGRGGAPAPAQRATNPGPGPASGPGPAPGPGPWLASAQDGRLTGEDTRSFSRLLLDETRYREFLRERATDFIFERPSTGRFRCDLHHQQGTVAISIRLMPRAIPSLQDLNLPAGLTRFAAMHRGLVLFCGPTGSGKSTTMAALIEIVNQARAVHIVTIEDPVEYLYAPGRAVVEQVEIGRDAVTFAAALRHALRQDPDVLLVGEMRDLDSIAIALRAAETGHLVFSTLHTGDAAQTIDRLIDAFPDTQQNQVRQQLSLCLAGIVVQTLVPSADGAARYPAVEIMIATDPVRNLIRTGKSHLLYSQMTVSKKDGMVTMEDSLAALFRASRITAEDAMLRASHREELQKLLD